MTGRCLNLGGLAAAMLLAGCEGAGVPKVESLEARWQEGAAWRLSEKPSLQIRSGPDEPDRRLLAVTDAVRLGDGTVVIANSGSSELRYYDAPGGSVGSSDVPRIEPLLTDRPTAFVPSRLWAVSDSVMAYDFSQRKVFVFGPDHSLARSFQLRADPFSAVSVIGAVKASWLLAGAQGGWPAPMTTGVRRDSVYYIRFDMAGAVIDTVGRFPGDEMYVSAEGDRRDVVRPAFGRVARAAVFEAGFYFGDGDSAYEIAVYSWDGRLQRLIRTARSNREVTAEDIAGYEDRRLDPMRDPEQRRRWQRLLARMPFPETMPAYGRFVVDAEGNLWVEDYRRPGEEEVRWTVFDPKGVMLGSVEMPDPFHVFEIGADYVLGRWADAPDDEQVRVYELIKGR